jgi:phenylpropionate dioxygenase-like ring-hydroxylating dioxygenase large terminal subunit
MSPTAQPPARPGPRVRDVLSADEVPPPAQMLEESFVDQGDDVFDRARWTSAEFHRRELDRMWSRTWQMACHVTQVPAVGDHVLYEIGDDSLVVVRSTPDEIRALHNSCLHRGNLLRTEGGCVESLRCRYHGWTWGLDGRFRGSPCPWDFAGVDRASLQLPEAHVAIWAGWVFVNLAADPEPFDAYIENLDALSAGFDVEHRAITLHMQKVVAGNWKAAMEAFLESYHVSMSHPQIRSFSGDYQTQYDVWPGVRHVSRMIVPYGIPSPSYEEPVDPDAVIRFVTGDAGPQRADGESVRSVVSRHKRVVYGQRFGVDLADRSDSDMLDAIQLFLFPNFVPWLGTGQPYAYRFRPFGHDPDRAVMDVYVLAPTPPGAPLPPAPPTHVVAEHEVWASSPGVATIGTVLDQDMPNVSGVQRGMKAGRTPFVRFGTYQESRIRHFHRTLDAYLGGA